MISEAYDIVKRIDFHNIKDHPNILIAANFWEQERYEAARVCYRFMRIIDDMIDDRKADDEMISCLEKQAMLEKVYHWISCLDVMNNKDPFVREIIDTVERFKIPLQLFHSFSESMIHDINNDGFTSFDQFLQYSEGASVAPASVFVHLCCLNKNEDGSFNAPSFHVADAARPCAIFSYLVHIMRDFQKDQLENLNYFPLDLLQKYGLEPADLKRMALGEEPVSDQFRKLIRVYCKYAAYYQDKTLEQLDKLSFVLEPRYLLSLHIIYNLYKQVYDRIDIDQGHFTTRELNPEPEEVELMVYEVIASNL